MAADILLRRGVHVSLFDQGVRGAGGRCSSRTLPDTDALTVDHGAQGVRFARDDARVLQLLNEWREAGVLSEWMPRRGVLHGSSSSFSPLSAEAFAALPSDRASFAQQVLGGLGEGLLAFTPGASALAGHLTRPRPGLTYHAAARVSALERCASGWTLQAVGVETPLPVFQGVVVAAAQAARPGAPGYVSLRGAVPPAVAAAWSSIAAVPHMPLLSLLLLLPARLTQHLPFDLAATASCPHIALLCRDSSKPGRRTAAGGDTEAWVCVSSPTFARQLMDAMPSSQPATRGRPTPRELDDVAEALWLRAAGHLGFDAELVTPKHRSAHRWSSARPAVPLGVPCLADGAVGFAACGDWANGGGIPGAMQSGLAAAEALLSAWSK